jgi:hypothetical protein
MQRGALEPMRVNSIPWWLSGWVKRVQFKLIPWWLWLIPIALLFIAIEKMPYGYYTFTRIVVCGFAVFFAFVAWEDGPVSRLWSAIFGLLAVLFNPIIPIYLSRGTWFYFDLLAASLFAAHLLVVRIGVIQTKSP